MEFFNKKQDVISLQITQFGRHLMSKGKFNPTYYAFFDDNILYEIEQAEISEEQNTSQQRIKDCPYIQPQISFTSLEENFEATYEIINNEQNKTQYDVESFQKIADNQYLLPSPLGTSGVDNNNPPSWHLSLLKGDITGSAHNTQIIGLDGGKFTLPIPQVDVEKKILFGNIDVIDEINSDEVEDDLAVSGGAIISQEDDLFILLKVFERNGTFQKDNFDIEIYEIIDNNLHDDEPEELRKLNFVPKANQETSDSWLEDEPQILDKDYVGYYFEILADDEIDDKIICKLDPNDEKRGVFADPRQKRCAELLGEDKLIVRDIYTDEEDYPGEIC